VRRQGNESLGGHPIFPQGPSRFDCPHIRRSRRLRKICTPNVPLRVGAGGEEHPDERQLPALVTITREERNIERRPADIKCDPVDGQGPWWWSDKCLKEKVTLLD